MKRKSMILLIFLSMILALVACSSNQELQVEEETYGLKVGFEMPRELLREATILRIEDGMEVKEVRVGIYEDGEEEGINKSLSGEELSEHAVEDGYQIVFSSIDAGLKYNIKVELWGSIRGEEEVVKLYKGESTSDKVAPESVIPVEVEVSPLPPQSLEVEIENIDELKVENVTLSHLAAKFMPGDLTSTKEYDEDEGVTFTGDDLDLSPARWLLSVKLANGRYDVNYDLLLLPSEEKFHPITVDPVTGDIEVAISVPESLPPVEDLVIEGGELTWSSEGAYYVIYRSRDSEPKTRQYITTIDEKVYGELEEDYYYWVRAISADGYSGQLSESVSLQ